MKKIMGRAMLLAGIALSLLFAFDVKTHVVYAMTDDDAVVVDDDPAPAEDADDDNESNTIKYVANADDDQMDKNASTQAKEVSKDPNVMKTKPMTDYTMSDSNSCWVPYWYWFVVMNNHSSSDIPKKHPANVKTSKKNVKKYQDYVNNKAENQFFNEFKSMMKFIPKIILLMTSCLIMAGVLIIVYKH